jgi:outer membrane protein OmpA-like peptidoglycan-associated protein
VTPTQPPEVTKSPVVIAIPKVTKPISIAGFAPGSHALTAQLRQALDELLKQNRNAKTVSCLGNTMGPTVLKGDAVLAKKRAMVVCDYLASKLGKTTKIVAKGQTTTVPSGKFRRTLMSFTN